MNDPFAHRPVMADEVLDLLAPVPPGIAVDATLGGGGHARLVLEARPDLEVLGIDRDPRAVEAARLALAAFGARVTVVHGGFADLESAVGERRHAGHAASEAPASEAPEDHARDGAAPVVAVLFDLGVSSPQLDRPERGFSYRHDGPLDMRMDTTQDRTAADLVNEAPEGELARILRAYGEERFARRIARRIVEHRPLHSTGELADVITGAIPAATRRQGPHPARRSFQALRIALNDELGQLEAGLDAALRVVAPGGRIVVLSYHSLEDRIVKRRFSEWATGGSHPPGLPVRETSRGGVVDLLTRRPRRPSDAEVTANPRAESARLRAVERRTGEAA